jgi:hypothetical protein
MSPHDDRRASPRFQPKPEHRAIYGETFAPIRDLSLDGLFVLDSDPLPVGSEVSFTIRAGYIDILLDGIVRRTLDGEGMGIQFKNVAAVSKRRLRIYLAGLVAAPGQPLETPSQEAVLVE